MGPSKKHWILLALKTAPLDRIQLMKTLFLLWYRSDRKIAGYFHFEPYLYGPYSLEVYSVLAELSGEGLIVQAPQPVSGRAKYYLTRQGMTAVEGSQKAVGTEMFQSLQSVVQEVAQLGFYELLKRVYSEAPEFAVNSIVR